MAAPAICVALAGPAGVGKSTLLKALLDNEHETLEFAFAKIYSCSSSSTRATCYRSCDHLLDMEANGCDTGGHEMERLSLSRRAGFIDCPGNHALIATTLRGIMMADGVLVLSQPADGFGASPAFEVLAAAHLMRRRIVVVQIIKNAADRHKVDQHQQDIRRCIKQLNDKIPSGVGVDVPIVKISATSVLRGIGDICRRMIGMVPVIPFPPGAEHEQAAAAAASSSSSDSPSAFMLIAGSRMVDPVGEEEDAVAAAAAAAGDATLFVTMLGRLEQGVVSAADEVEVRPGIVTMADDGELVYQPITFKVTSVAQGDGHGHGLVVLRASATILNVDANRRHLRLARSVLGGVGGMEGHVLGHSPGCLPAVYDQLKINVLLLPTMVDPYTDQVYDPVPRVKEGERLLLVVGTMSTFGRVKEVSGPKGRTIVVTDLSPPTCARYQERILVCRKLMLACHLIGSGTIVAGAPLTMIAPPPA